MVILHKKDIFRSFPAIPIDVVLPGFIDDRPSKDRL